MVDHTGVKSPIIWYHFICFYFKSQFKVQIIYKMIEVGSLIVLHHI